jgi:hypothetical protein
MGLLSKFRDRLSAANGSAELRRGVVEAQVALSPSGAERAPGYVTWTENEPEFAPWEAGVYDHDLSRAAIERFATACSKLKPEVIGSERCKPHVRRMFATRPNPWQTWPQFLAMVATRREVDTTAYIVPMLDDRLRTVGVWSLRPYDTKVVEYRGEMWYRFVLRNGETLAVECSRCVTLSRFQLESDIFGGDNAPLSPTLELMDSQRRAERDAVRNGARVRFIGRVQGLVHGEALEEKRRRFYEENIGPSNRTGLMLYDSTFDDVQVVDEKRFVLDEAEMKRVSDGVGNYFGTNEAILRNDYSEEQWGAYYEGKVEPFAIELSEGMTFALYSDVEVMHGNRVMFSSNRLEYATNASKRNMIRDMTEKPVMTINDARAVLQLPPVPWGDVFLARGEYYMIDADGNVVVRSGGEQEAIDAAAASATTEPLDIEKDFDLGGDDDEYADTEAHGMKETDEE